MQKATFAELKSGSEQFIAICVSRLKSLPELYKYACYIEQSDRHCQTYVLTLKNRQN